jgi:iron complex transport system ATP-binding protein
MGNTALLIDGLSLSIRGKPILRNVSAQIEAGKTWSVIGPNGAGKSTLLKCLMQIQIGWTGGLFLDGLDVRGLSQREMARRVAYVPQPGGDHGLHYTVREFVRMGRYAWCGLFGSKPGDSAAVENAMRRAKVEDFADRPLNNLSGGERQKVFIAAALAQSSGVLLLDEPTAFLDYHHQSEVAQIVRELNQQCGATILSVTHDVNAAMLTGGYILALRDGEVAWSGLASELACERTLGRIFGATFRFLDDPVTNLRLVAPQGARVPE